VHFEVPGTRVRGTGKVVFARAIETPIGVRFAVGVQRRRRVEIAPGKEIARLEAGRVPGRMGRAGRAVVAVVALTLGLKGTLAAQPVRAPADAVCAAPAAAAGEAR
jgi:hypothetical protein